MNQYMIYVELIIFGYCRENYDLWLPLDILDLFYKFYDEGGSILTFQNNGYRKTDWELSNFDRTAQGISITGGTLHYLFGKYSYKNNGIYHWRVKYVDGCDSVKCFVGITEKNHLDLLYLDTKKDINKTILHSFVEIHQKGAEVVIKLDYDQGVVSCSCKRSTSNKTIDKKKIYYFVLLSEAYYRWQFKYEIIPKYSDNPYEYDWH